MYETNIAEYFSLSLIRMDPFQTQNDVMDLLDYNFSHYCQKYVIWAEALIYKTNAIVWEILLTQVGSF